MSPHLQDGGMAVRARMTPSHQSVEDVRRCVREAQAKGAGHGPQAPMSEFNEEVHFRLLSLSLSCWMASQPQGLVNAGVLRQLHIAGCTHDGLQHQCVRPAGIPSMQPAQEEYMDSDMIGAPPIAI
jgi:hypothetical protein